MSTPPPNRSAYRERRINVMLQDESASAPQTSSDLPAPAPSAPFRATVPPPPTPTSTSTRAKSVRNRLVWMISVGTALLCAAIVFFVLFRRDNSQVVRVSEAQTPGPQVTPTPPLKSSPAPAITSPEAAPAPSVGPLAAPPTQPGSEGERVHFRLKRSARVQSFGTLKLRLLSSSPRRGLCQIAVSNADDHAQRTIEINRPASIKLADDTTVELLVNGMTRDAVSGFVTAHPK